MSASLRFHTNRFMHSRVPQRFLVFVRWLFGAVLLAGMGMANSAPFAYLADGVTNDYSVIDMAGYNTIVTAPLGATRTAPSTVVANEASGKIFVAESSGVVIIDAATNTITGEVLVGPGPTPPATSSGVKTLVVSTDGTRVYALTPGVVTVIDPAAKSIITSIAVDPSAAGMAIDPDGETVYVSHTGYLPDTGMSAGAAGITIIDALSNEVDEVVGLSNFLPAGLAVHPTGDNLLYIAGSIPTSPENLAYLVLDPATRAVMQVEVEPPAGTPLIFSFSRLAFNQDGSRLYLGGSSFGMETIPLLEVNAATGAVTRVLSIVSGYADNHFVAGMSTSFADNKFVLAVFLSEHLHHYPSEPPRRVVFVDGLSGNVLKDLSYPSPTRSDYVIGDILDSVTGGGGAAPTTTVLQASANPPLRRNVPISFFARVTGNNPSGKVVFKFVAREDRNKLVEKIPVALDGNTATLALPACRDRWDNRALRKIVCKSEFKVVAKYRGDANNARSKSDVLYETR